MTAPAQFGGGYSPGLRTVSTDLDPSVDWLASEHFMVKQGGITIDYTTVPANSKGQRILRGGTAIGKITVSGKYGPYLPQTNEVQSVTVTGGPTSGTFALTFAGQTATIPFNATAAQAQALLEGLSNINPGDVLVTGGPLPGSALVVTFKGQYIGTDVAAMTKNAGALGGGTSPDVTIATTTAGGANPGAADGREVGTGFLFPGDIDVQWGDTLAGMLIHGSVLEARCTGVDSAFKADMGGRVIFQ